MQGTNRRPVNLLGAAGWLRQLALGWPSRISETSQSCKTTFAGLWRDYRLDVSCIAVFLSVAPGAPISQEGS